MTTFRLGLAALLCAVPFGWTWSSSITPGYTLFGDCGYSTGPYCTTDQYIAGTSSFTAVSQAPVRVFLVFAVGALVWCALHVRTPATRRLARAAVVAMLAGAALAAGNGSSDVLVCLVLAALLVGPLVFRVRGLPRFGVPAPERVK